MKSLFKLALILIGLIIFAYTGACKAQNAWVLWEKYHVSRSNPFIENTIWEMKSAYPNYAMYVEVAERFAKYQEERGYRRNGVTAFYKFDDGNEQLYQYLCFPDTIDPRK